MNINDLVIMAHGNARAKGFYESEINIMQKLMEGEKLESNEMKIIATAFKVQKLALIICEATEAIEALRKGDIVEHDEEIADIIIRAGDYSGAYSVDLENEVISKMEKNSTRPYKHGKKF